MIRAIYDLLLIKTEIYFWPVFFFHQFFMLFAIRRLLLAIIAALVN